MKYVFECECAYPPEEVIRTAGPSGSPVIVCPEHGKRVTGRRVFCKNPDCGKEFDTAKSGAGSEHCPDCRRFFALARMREYQRRGKVIQKIKSLRPIIAESYAGLKPDPVIRNPHASPCGQGCSVIKITKTYDNMVCMGCSYRVQYVAGIAAASAPEYTTVQPERAYA